MKKQQKNYVSFLNFEVAVVLSLYVFEHQNSHLILLRIFMLQIFVFCCQNCNLYCISTLQRSLSKEMRYTTKFLIDNVSAKLPCRAFAILRKSWEMIVNPDVDGYQTTLDNPLHMALTSGSKTLSSVTVIWIGEHLAIQASNNVW